MIATIVCIVFGLAGTGSFFALWRKERALNAHLRSSDPSEEVAYDPMKAPHEDEWAVRQFRLMELAWLGYDEAHACMDGGLAPYSRRQLEAVNTGNLNDWDGFKRLNAYLRDVELEGWEDSDDDSVDDWLEQCEEAMGEKIPKRCIRLVLGIDECERMALFDSVCDRSPRLVRLSKGDRTALSLGPVELVAYLRDIGVDEKRVAEALRCHSDHLKAMSSVDQELSLFQANERMRQAVDRAVGDELVNLKAVVDALPPTERAKARERVETLERRILELRDRQEAERVRVKLDEVEIAVEAEAEVAAVLGKTASS